MASAPWVRWVVLACNCLLTFGTYYCFDMPSILKTDLQDTIIEPWSPGNGSTLYSLFYLVYCFCNMAMSLVAGVLVDRFGVKICCFAFLTLCLFGQTLYAAAPMVVSMTERSRYMLMFGGRFLFGLGGGPITIVQNAITVRWFKGKELAMAFGFTLTVSRLGSVINFSLTSAIYGAFASANGLSSADICSNSTPVDAAFSDACSRSIGATFFVGAGLIVFSYFPAVLLFALSSRYTTEAGHGEGDATVADEDHVGGDGGEEAAETTVLAATRQLSSSFWLICAIIALFYSVIFGFLADAKDYITYAYGMDDGPAGFAAGLCYLCSMIVSPFLGRAVDYFGRRAHLAIYGTGCAVLAFVLFRWVPGATAYVPMLLLGSAYCVCAATLWPGLQLLVPIKRVGLANGLATSVQMLAIGCSIIAAGKLQDTAKANGGPNDGYDPVVELFLANASAAVVLAVLLLRTDERGGRKLRLGQRDKNRSRGDAEESLLPWV